MVTQANALFDYIRDLEANGIPGATWQVVRLYDDFIIASGTTVLDSDPNTPLDGKLAVAENVLGYPGPIKYRVTDPMTGITREHTSKSIGIIGPYRMLDLPFGFAMMLDGVVEDFQGELAVTTPGTTPARVTVAPGICFGHGMIYRWTANQTVTIDPGGAAMRRDLVAVRFYLPGNEQEGRIDIVVRKGVEGAAVLPPIQDDTSTMRWEVPLAEIQVDAGVTMIASGKITDRRAFTIGPRLDSRYLRKDVFDEHTGYLIQRGDFHVHGTDGVRRAYVKTEPGLQSFQLRNQTDFIIYKGEGSDVSLRVDGLTGHLLVGNESGDRPTVSVHSPLGTGRSGSVGWGSDTMFELTLHAGTSPGVGDLCFVNFRRDRSSTNYGVWLMPHDRNAAELDAYVSNRSVDGFGIFSRGPLHASADHAFFVFVGGAN